MGIIIIIIIIMTMIVVAIIIALCLRFWVWFQFDLNLVDIVRLYCNGFVLRAHKIISSFEKLAKQVGVLFTIV